MNFFLSGRRLFLVGFVFGIITAVVTSSGEDRPNAGALPLVGLSRRVTDIVDRGLCWRCVNGFQNVVGRNDRVRPQTMVLQFPSSKSEMEAMS